MKRLWLIILGLVVALGIGGYVFVSRQLDTLGPTISTAVERATGKPLVLSAQPRLQIFPSLGLDLGRSSWGTPGKDELAVSVRSALVRVDLMELFSRKIVINAVVLDAPHVVVNSAQTAGMAVGGAVGASVGDAAAAAGAEPKELRSGQAGAEKAEQAKKSANPDAPVWHGVRLDHLAVNDGVIDVNDVQGTLRLSNVLVRAEGLAPGTPGKVDVGFKAVLQAKSKGKNSAGEIEADLELKSKILPEYPLITVRAMELTLTPIRGLAVNAPVQVAGSGAMDMALGGINNLDVTAMLAGSSIHVRGKGSLGGPSGEAVLEAKGVLRDLLAACSVPYRAKDPKALGDYTLSARVRMDGGGGSRLRIDDLKGSLDATKFSGQAVSTWPERIEGKLHLDRLALDGYLPAQGGKAKVEQARAPAAGAQASDKPGGQTSDKPGGASTPAPAAAPAAQSSSLPSLTIALDVDSLQAAGVEVKNLRSKLTGTAPRYNCASTGLVFGSSARVDIGADLGAARYTLKSVMDKVYAEPLFKTLAGLDGVSGLLNLHTDLSAQGTDEAALRRSLGGTANLSGQLDIDTKLLPADWSRIIRDVRTINMDTISVQAKAERGQVVLNPVTATGKLLKLQGQGRIDLPADFIELRMNASLSGVGLPLFVRGPLGSPSFGLDAAGLIQTLSDPSERKNIEQGIKSLLRGLR